MSIWSRLFGPANATPRYRAGPVGLGVGVSNLALEQPGRAVDADFYSPRYMVRGSISPRMPTLPNPGQFLPATDLRANGVYLSGDMALAALIAGAEK
jgi:hypothetical protein